MNYLKVNIFDFLEKRKTIFMNNVKSFFGERIIDILLHYPNSINNKNLRIITVRAQWSRCSCIRNNKSKIFYDRS